MDQIRVGIVGCGEVTQIIHLPSLYRLSDQFTVTAICDVSPTVLDGVGTRWNVAKRYGHYQDLVADPALVAAHVSIAPGSAADVGTGPDRA